VKALLAILCSLFIYHPTSLYAAWKTTEEDFIESMKDVSIEVNGKKMKWDEYRKECIPSIVLIFDKGTCNVLDIDATNVEHKEYQGPHRHRHVYRYPNGRPHREPRGQRHPRINRNHRNTEIWYKCLQCGKMLRGISEMNEHQRETWHGNYRALKKRLQ
jgi:hypothetical protein